MALMRVLTQRFQLGMFDPPEQQPWSTIPMDVVGSQRHLEAAIEAVRKGTSTSNVFHSFDLTISNVIQVI